MTPISLRCKLICVTEAEALLADVQTLRRQTRRDRQGYAFPLFLFGALILLAPLCYISANLITLPDGFTIYDTYGSDPFPMFAGFVPLKYPALVGWYWFLVIVVGIAATAWWYRRRALRIGVESDTKGYLFAAGAALTAFLIGVPLLESVVQAHNTLYSTPAENLPILFGSAVASALVFLWCSRKTRTSTQRTIGIFAGTLLATVAFSALGVYMYKGFSALLIIAVGLLGLAWVERSALLAIIAVLFTAASIPANHQLWYWDFPNQFYDWWGWGSGWEDGRADALLELVVPAAILLIGGVVAVMVNRRSAAR